MHVAGLFRHPVKSMLGEEIEQAHLGVDGLDRDRRLALIEAATGLVASAKQPTKWGPLLQCRARLTGEDVAITFPDGRTSNSAADDIDTVLSEYCGRAVTLSATPPPTPHLEREWPAVDGLAPPQAIAQAGTVTPLASAAPGTFVDYAPLHLVTTATLRALRAGGSQNRFDARRFRPNLLLDVPGEAFVENAWEGRRLTIGDATVEIITVTPRCAVPALAHGDLPAEPDVLRTVVSRNRVAMPRGRFACVGAYARIVMEGDVHVGAEAILGI